MAKMGGDRYPKCPRIYLPSLSAQAPKVLDFNEKRLHLASVVRVSYHSTLASYKLLFSDCTGLVLQRDL